MENIDFMWGKLASHESIVLHIFKMRKNSAANFQESPLPKAMYTVENRDPIAYIREIMRTVSVFLSSSGLVHIKNNNPDPNFPRFPEP